MKRPIKTGPRLRGGVVSEKSADAIVSTAHLHWLSRRHLISVIANEERKVGRGSSNAGPINISTSTENFNSFGLRPYVDSRLPHRSHAQAHQEDICMWRREREMTM